MSAVPQPGPGGRSRNPATARHSAARLAAVQALYQMEIAGSGLAATVKEFERFRLGAADPESSGGRKVNQKLFGALVSGVEEHREALDALIAPRLAGWSVDRLEVILRAILRLGAFELRHRVEMPARAVVSEYVRLADSFFSGAEPGMVNGVLDAVARAVRPGEMERGHGGDAPSG
ncbi:MAG: transcription antitermination factor NusB [Alphaproteobacteria bacterium]|nr:transcription antitermination factor NusB [Alphaproteobacteria bacterium]